MNEFTDTLTSKSIKIQSNNVNRKKILTNFSLSNFYLQKFFQVKQKIIRHQLAEFSIYELIVWLRNIVYSQMHQADVQSLVNAILDKTTF